MRTKGCGHETPLLMDFKEVSFFNICFESENKTNIIKKKMTFMSIFMRFEIRDSLARHFFLNKSKELSVSVRDVFKLE